MSFNELRWVDFLRKQAKSARGVLAGIGDDCAVIKQEKGCLLVSSDLFIENVHFKLKDISFSSLGKRACARALSDIFACCGKAEFVIVSCGFPSYVKSSHLKEIFKGIESVALECEASVIGGDTAKSQKLFLDIWVMGKAKHPVLRGGAKAKDCIFVTGRLGKLPFNRPFLPKFKEAEYLASQISPHAMIDISDGFILDLFRLVRASNKGAVLKKENLPLSKGFSDLYRGEDYELLFTCSCRHKEKLLTKGFFCVGEVIEEKGIFLADGKSRRKIPPQGYMHF